MSNKVNYIEIKPTHATFLMILSIQKNMIIIKLKKMKTQTKIFLFTTLDIWRSKIGDT